MKVGDIVRCTSGGACLVIEAWGTWEEYKKQLNERLPDAGDPIWSNHDFPVIRILHSSGEIIEEPSYCYEELS
jgi:hypothetical protein